MVIWFEWVGTGLGTFGNCEDVCFFVLKKEGLSSFVSKKDFSVLISDFASTVDGWSSLLLLKIKARL